MKAIVIFDGCKVSVIENEEAKEILEQMYYRNLYSMAHIDFAHITDDSTYAEIRSYEETRKFFYVNEIIT